MLRVHWGRQGLAGHQDPRASWVLWVLREVLVNQEFQGLMVDQVFLVTQAGLVLVDPRVLQVELVLSVLKDHLD